MTSDAKIGLLLGLVFIFVIAFIINGLPNFGDRSRAEATPMMHVSSENFGVVDQARTAQERLDWQGILEQEGQDLPPVATTAAPSGSSATLSETTAASESGEVRRVYTLDGWVGGVSGKIQEVVKGLLEPVPPEETTARMDLPIESPQAETAQTRPAETASAPPTTSAPAPAPTQKPAPAAAAPQRIYVVEDGDVLATVAKKAYGPEEGNRLVNVNRIFEANRDKLKSPDEIVVGQKLVIPPLPKTETAKTDDAKLSEALFEKVEQIGKRNVAEVQAPKPAGTVYIVQDGDSLWKIAGSQLGSGARWEEIVKLNTDTLKSKDATLVIGMQLRLPPK